MPSKICVKCGFENSADVIKPSTACPGCGVIYWKAERAANVVPATEKTQARAKEQKASAQKETKLQIKILAILLGVLGYGLFQGFGPAEPKYKPQANPASCIEGSACWKEKQLSAAYSPCSRAIESLANYDFEWTNGFEHARFNDGILGLSSEVIVFSGSQLKLQNGFGAWASHSYACYWNADTQSVVEYKILD